MLDFLSLSHSEVIFYLLGHFFHRLSSNRIRKKTHMHDCGLLDFTERKSLLVFHSVNTFCTTTHQHLRFSCSAHTVHPPLAHGSILPPTSRVEQNGRNYLTNWIQLRGLDFLSVHLAHRLHRLVCFYRFRMQPITKGRIGAGRWNAGKEKQKGVMKAVHIGIRTGHRIGLTTHGKDINQVNQKHSFLSVAWVSSR